MRRRVVWGWNLRRTVARALPPALLVALCMAASASAGQLWGWGSNSAGQLTKTATGIWSNIPVRLESLTEVSAFSAGGDNGYALTPGGPVAWGSNRVAQLDIGTYPGPETCEHLEFPCARTPAPMVGLEAATQVSVGNGHGLARLEGGRVLSWGENQRGQLGDGTAEGPERCEEGHGFANWCSKSAIEVPGVSEAVAVAAGEQDSFALLADGEVMAWGDDESGRLGDGGSTDRHTPFLLPGLSGVSKIATSLETGGNPIGAGSTVALLGDGEVMMWGTAAPHTPTLVAGLSGVTAIAANANFDLALLEDGHVMTFSSPTSVSEVAGLSGVTAIAANGRDGFALLSSGRVMSWGVNESGSLGIGVSGPEQQGPFEPSPVCSLTGVTKIASGNSFSYAYSPSPETIPAVTGVSPTVGLPVGGTKVTITGANFEGATSVRFGSSEASFTVLSPTTIEATAPAGEEIQYVTVSSSEGTSPACRADRFRYEPPSQVDLTLPHRGSSNTTVTLYGRLEEVSAVYFGSQPAASFTKISTNAVIARPPAGLLGTVDVRVSAPGGESDRIPGDRITLVPSPEYGRCLANKASEEGSFGGSTCISTTDNGAANKWVWAPSFEGSSQLVKAGVKGAIKPTTKILLTTSGAHTITCTGATSSGAFTGLRETSLSLVLTGCSMSANSCQSTEAASGEVRFAALTTTLGLIKTGTEPKRNSLGLDFHAASGETLASFSCAGTPVVLSGSAIGTVAAIDSMVTTETQKFTATKSVQKPQRFEGGPEAVLHATIGAGAPELAGLNLTLTQTSEEKVEISAIL